MEKVRIELDREAFQEVIELKDKLKETLK